MVSKRCQYALRAVLELARHELAGRMPISEIAKAQGIPPRFLEAILRQLKQAGITESTRGKVGGYSLARSSREITLGDVVRVFETPFSEKEDGEVANDVFREVWARADEALDAVYDDVTFHALVRRQRELSAGQSPNYSI